MIEVKLAHSKAEIATKMAEAKQQLMTRQYDVHLTTKQIVALALVVNDNTAMNTTPKSTQHARITQRKSEVVIEQVDISGN